MEATAHAPQSHDSGHDHGHKVPLWGLFIALLVLTAAEVGLFEFWSHSNKLAQETGGQPFIPKFAMVLLLLIFTLPKALIVLIYFMHLKFEKQFIVLLAVIPFLVAPIAVLVPTADNQTLLKNDRMLNHAEGLSGFNPNAKAHGEGHGEHGAEHKEAPKPASSNETY